jgi:hypothetical protein
MTLVMDASAVTVVPTGRRSVQPARNATCASNFPRMTHGFPTPLACSAVASAVALATPACWAWFIAVTIPLCTAS